MNNFTRNLSLCCFLLAVLCGSRICCADVCTSCGGFGWQINQFQKVKCKTCNGDGVVDSGGIPTLPNPIDYQSTKGELMRAVENNGEWKAAWSNDLTETDLAEGVGALVASILSENPTFFFEWLRSLINKTIKSLKDSAIKIAPEVLKEMEQMAFAVMKEAVKGRSAKEAIGSFGQVDLKAGAIRYEGRTYIGTANTKTAWGLKLYVAVRIRKPGDPTYDPHAVPSGQAPNGLPVNDGVTEFDDSVKTYRVTTKTGKRMGAGTNADVFISVTGDKGIKHAIRLDIEGINDHELGSTGAYTFEARNLGEILDIVIWHDNSGVRPGWFLEEVAVENVTDQQKWYFECGRWLAVDEGDRSINRKLSPIGSVE